MPILAGRTLVVVDTETTGFDPLAGHEVIEVAVVGIADGALTTEWSSLIRPSRPIPRDSSEIHGITDAMVATAPTAAEAAAALRERCADHTVAFHNALFDLPFVRALLRGAGQPPILAPVIDTLGLARGLFGPGGNSLAPLAQKLGLPEETAHRALPDARTTARALLRLAERWEREKGAASLDELAAASLDQIRIARRSRPIGVTGRPDPAPAAPAPGPLVP